MSDVPGYAAVVVSCAALGWTAFVDIQRRRDAKRQADAVVHNAISILVAQWEATRLRTITVSVDPNLTELKESAKRWRDHCANALAVLPQNSRARDLVEEQIAAASAFEEIIDPLRASHYVEDEDKPAVQVGLTRAQQTISKSISNLIALSASRAGHDAG